MRPRAVNTKIAQYLTKLLRDDEYTLVEMDRLGELRSWVRERVRDAAEDEDLLKLIIRESGLSADDVLDEMPLDDLLDEAKDLAEEDP